MTSDLLQEDFKQLQMISNTASITTPEPALSQKLLKETESTAY